MSPIQRDYLIYGLAVSAGFITYMVLDRVLGLEMWIAMMAGFGIIHASIVLGRRYL